MDGATIFVSLSLSDDCWPFLIENDSSHTVTFCQAVSPVPPIRCRGAHYKQDATHTVFDPAKSYPIYRLPEHSSFPYAWDFPVAREKELLLTINGSRRLVDILEIGNLVPFKFQVSEKHS